MWVSYQGGIYCFYTTTCILKSLFTQSPHTHVNKLCLWVFCHWIWGFFASSYQLCLTAVISKGGGEAHNVKYIFLTIVKLLNDCLTIISVLVQLLNFTQTVFYLAASADRTGVNLKEFYYDECLQSEIFLSHKTNHCCHVNG